MSDLYKTLLKIKEKWAQKSGEFELWSDLDDLIEKHEGKCEKELNVKWRCINPADTDVDSGVQTIAEQEYKSLAKAVEWARTLNNAYKRDAHWVEEL